MVLIHVLLNKLVNLCSQFWQLDCKLPPTPRSIGFPRSLC